MSFYYKIIDYIGMFHYYVLEQSFYYIIEENLRGNLPLAIISLRTYRLCPGGEIVQETGKIMCQPTANM